MESLDRHSSTAFKRATPKVVARWLLALGTIVYLSLFLYNSLTRAHLFSPDSMNYVDVARNLSSGEGLVQSTLGFNQPFLFGPDSKIPTPFTSQPPLYPILIAAVSRLGIEQAHSALLISGIAYGLLLLIAYHIVRRLYDGEAAVLAVGFLLVYPHLRSVARFAWTETIGMSFVLLCLYLLLEIKNHMRSQKLGMLWSALIGLSAGLAFITRYALFPIFPIGAIVVLLTPREKKSGLANLLMCLVGFTVPAFPVILHTYLASGTLLPVALASDWGLGPNLSSALSLLFLKSVWSGLPGGRLSVGNDVQLGFSVMLLIGAVALMVRSRRPRTLLNTLLLKDGRYLLLLWFCGYLGLLFYRRTVSHFDPVNVRLIFPAGIILPVVFAALCTECLRPKVSKYNLHLSLFLLLVGCVMEIQLLRSWPVFRQEQYIAQSQRLHWITESTNGDDLIIGDDTVDVPFYLGRNAVSFSPYPYTIHLGYDRLVDFVSCHRHAYRNFYLVLLDHLWQKGPLEDDYGVFIADIIGGRLDSYQNIIYLGHLGARRREDYPDLIYPESLDGVYVYRVLPR